MTEMTSMNEAKRIPYGMMNFVAVREDNCYYVDKTRFIEKVEKANKYFFFIRPRRFGKSLTMSMLRHYYDINAVDKFDRLYGDLYIGKHPTPDHNTYLIIHLNFAVVNADLATTAVRWTPIAEQSSPSSAKGIPVCCPPILKQTFSKRTVR